MTRLDFSRVLKWLLILVSTYVFYMVIMHNGYYSRVSQLPRNGGYGRYTISTKLNDDYSTKSDTERNKGERSIFEDVGTLLLFIGYPRSGSTLVGSILDAHPNIMIANEYNLFAHWKNFSSEQKTRDYVFRMLWLNSIRESKLHRSEKKHYFFSYHVPGAWQGRFLDGIKVIGDKKGMSTTRYLTNTKRTDLYMEIRDTVNIPIKFIHLIRNPFDNVATMTLRAAHPKLRKKAEKKNLQFNNSKILQDQMEIYFNLVDQNVNLRRKYGSDVLDVHYSSFIRQPEVWLKTICDFLEVYCDEDYLQKCVEVIFKKETYTRRHIVWPDAFKQQIMDKIHQVDFLNGLKFDIT